MTRSQFRAGMSSLLQLHPLPALRTVVSTKVTPFFHKKKTAATRVPTAYESLCRIHKRQPPPTLSTQFPDLRRLIDIGFHGSQREGDSDKAGIELTVIELSQEKILDDILTSSRQLRREWQDDRFVNNEATLDDILETSEICRRDWKLSCWKKRYDVLVSKTTPFTRILVDTMGAAEFDIHIDYASNNLLRWRFTGAIFPTATAHARAELEHVWWMQGRYNGRVINTAQELFAPWAKGPPKPIAKPIFKIKRNGAAIFDGHIEFFHVRDIPKLNEDATRLRCLYYMLSENPGAPLQARNRKTDMKLFVDFESPADDLHLPEGENCFFSQPYLLKRQKLMLKKKGHLGDQKNADEFARREFDRKADKEVKEAHRRDQKRLQYKIDRQNRLAAGEAVSTASDDIISVTTRCTDDQASFDGSESYYLHRYIMNKLMGKKQKDRITAWVNAGMDQCCNSIDANAPLEGEVEPGDVDELYRTAFQDVFTMNFDWRAVFPVRRNELPEDAGVYDTKLTGENMEAFGENGEGGVSTILFSEDDEEDEESDDDDDEYDEDEQGSNTSSDVSSSS